MASLSIDTLFDGLAEQLLPVTEVCNAASFVTIGEPDIRLRRKDGSGIVGLDTYDPVKDEVESRDVHDITYRMVDDDYDGSNFIVRQVFFCGGDKDEFNEHVSRPFSIKPGQKVAVCVISQFGEETTKVLIARNT